MALKEGRKLDSREMQTTKTNRKRQQVSTTIGHVFRHQHKKHFSIRQQACRNNFWVTVFNSFFCFFGDEGGC